MCRARDVATAPLTPTSPTSNSAQVESHALPPPPPPVPVHHEVHRVPPPPLVPQRSAREQLFDLGPSPKRTLPPRRQGSLGTSLPASTSQPIMSASSSLASPPAVPRVDSAPRPSALTVPHPGLHSAPSTDTFETAHTTLDPSPSPTTPTQPDGPQLMPDFALPPEPAEKLFAYGAQSASAPTTPAGWTRPAPTGTRKHSVGADLNKLLASVRHNLSFAL
jgi:hypothetical protein